MLPRLTKSLFVEFVTNPHVARRHVHNKQVYTQILEILYGSMDGLAVWKAVEDQVQYFLQSQNAQLTTINVEKMHRAHSDWYKSYHTNTCDAIRQNPDVIYQAWMCYDNLFVKTDYLVKNSEWTYDLWEVKAKNSVRKKTAENPLIDDIVSDISFQHFVLKKVFPEQYSGRAMVVYLNKDYIKQWPIDASQLLVMEDVTDELRDDAKILETITMITTHLWKPREEFVEVFPYSGEDHFTFFWEKSQPWSIWHIPQIRDGKALLYHQNKHMIAWLSEEDRAQLFSNKQEETKASKYISLWQQWEKIINQEHIRNLFAWLEFPLYFYDYETVSRPIPLLDGTRPWQQVVVQYSVHLLQADGTITHMQDIIQPWETDNSRVVANLMRDLWWSGEQKWTYIVWYKWFENTRNTEIAQQYPQYETLCQYVNEHTFDLMEIFSELHYFHRDFHGSASIKKVLPVMTDITYDTMAIGHGGLAADTLMKIITNQLDTTAIQQQTKNLLEYCTQDTRAMVRIYEEVKKELE